MKYLTLYVTENDIQGYTEDSFGIQESPPGLPGRTRVRVCRVVEVASPEEAEETKSGKRQAVPTVSSMRPRSLA